MDIPRRVGHDNVEFTQRGIVESAQVTVNPLRRKLSRGGVSKQNAEVGRRQADILAS